jgi:hypothetical protein
VGEREMWEGLEQVVFAISRSKMANEFAEAFGADVEVEAGPGGGTDDDDDEEEEEDEEEDGVAEELRTKIKEMEGQITHVWNPDLKARLTIILKDLRSRLAEREPVKNKDEEEQEQGGQGSNSIIHTSEDEYAADEQLDDSLDEEDDSDDAEDVARSEGSEDGSFEMIKH